MRVFTLLVVFAAVAACGRDEGPPPSPESAAATVALVNLWEAHETAMAAFRDDPAHADLDIDTLVEDLRDGVMAAPHQALLAALEAAGFFDSAVIAARASSLAPTNATMSLMTDRWEVDPEGNRRFEPGEWIERGSARDLVRTLAGAMAASDGERKAACFAAGLRLAEAVDSSDHDLDRLVAPAVALHIVSIMKEGLRKRSIDAETGARMDEAIATVAGRQWVRMRGIDVLHNTELQGARIYLAIERHRAVHGALPRTLEALVPEFLPSLPEDPTSRESFRYVLLEAPDEHGRDYLLYSIGVDREDNDGRTHPRGPHTALHGSDRDARREARGYDHLINYVRD